MIGFALNITQQKMAEQKVSAAQEELNWNVKSLFADFGMSQTRSESFQTRPGVI